MKNKKSKSGHFRSWSFSVIFKKSLVILSYSKYKYYLYYTIDDLFSPETKMTGNDHDRKKDGRRISLLVRYTFKDKKRYKGESAASEEMDRL